MSRTRGGGRSLRPVLALAAIWGTVAGCTDLLGEGADPVWVEEPTELTLRVGEEVRVGGSSVRARLFRVIEDSRCPSSVVCVWEGQGVVEIGLRAGEGPVERLQLSTLLDPRSVPWRSLRVTLIRLEPAPVSTDPIPEGMYRATLRIEPAP